MPVNNQSPYPLRYAVHPRKRKMDRARILTVVALLCIIGGCTTFILPQIEIAHIHLESMSLLQPANSPTTVAVFPVSVDPATKSIVDNPKADAFFNEQTQNNTLTASVGDVREVLIQIAALIDNTSLYQSLAAADGHLITVLPGYRKEEILSQLTRALNWNTTQQKQFLAAVDAQTPGITDGMFAPGTYVVDDSMTPSNVAALMGIRFDETVADHYSPTTASLVPLNETLIVASLLEREAAGPTDMRIISGIIWNRLFDNMNLQIDATLQYAMGENKEGNWWQEVLPKDKYIKSPYNTYMNPGLPPGPIAEPSVAAVLAALNPVQTSCLYYFHDSYGRFHCSDTYAEHVALLKKYYPGS